MDYEYNRDKLKLLERKARSLEMRSMKNLNNEDLREVVAGVKSLEQVHIASMKEKEWIYLLMHSDLEFFSFEAFKKLMKNDWVQNKIAQDLLARYGCFDQKNENKRFSRAEIDMALSLADKDLYTKFRDKEITFDQLMARMASKHNYGNYTVLDDIKDDLNEKLLGKSSLKYNMLDNKKGQFVHHDEINRKLEPFELSQHCMRSLLHNPKAQKPEKVETQKVRSEQ